MASTEPLAKPTQPASPHRRRGLLALVGGVILVVGGGIGAGVGAAVNSHASQLSADQAQIRMLQGKLVHAYRAAAIDQQQAATAQQTSADAVTRAQTQAAAQYASREAAVKRLLRKLQTEQGAVQANTISADGVYVVGQDIKPGTYHTSGAPGGGSPGGQCYYALLSSDNTSDIIDNNNFNGPETIDVSSAHALQISGGCVWTLISAG